MFATAEEVVAYYENLDKYQRRHFMEYCFNGEDFDELDISKVPSVITVTHAKKWLKAIKDTYIQNNMGKGTRPWDVVDVCASLDPNQTWIGIEYEGGYDNYNDYKRVMNYVWRNFMHSVVDYEGSGQYPCEITFAPVNVEDFMTSDYCLDRLLRYKKDKKIEFAHTGRMWCDECEEYHDDSGAMVGTHCNISTPAFRNHKSASHIGSIMGNSCNLISSDGNDMLFGRSPYGSMHTNITGRGHQYIEGKLFDSTNDMTKWQRYKAVILRLADVIEYLSVNYDKMQLSKYEDRYGHSTAHIENLEDILLGHVTPDAMVIGTVGHKRGLFDIGF